MVTRARLCCTWPTSQEGRRASASSETVTSAHRPVARLRGGQVWESGGGEGPPHVRRAHNKDRDTRSSSWVFQA